MRYLFVFIAALVSVLMMFITTKLVGYRQISELSMWDYINSITLGSIAADLAISEDIEVALDCFIAMVVYGAFTLLFSYLTVKSKKARGFLVGHPIVLMENGIMYRNSFKKAKLDLDEFLSMCRAAGYFDPFKIDTALLEPSGNISIIPKASDRPITTADMKLPAGRQTISANLIIDGNICKSNLKEIGKTTHWLENELKKVTVKNTKEIFLATLDSNGELHIFENTKKDTLNPL